MIVLWHLKIIIILNSMQESLMQGIDDMCYDVEFSLLLFFVLCITLNNYRLCYNDYIIIL